MVNILSFSTSSALCSVALHHDGTLSSLVIGQRANSHAEVLPNFIKKACKESNISIREIHAVAVDKGPGSYTGLRIGVTMAKGLAFALNIPLIALSSLDIMINEAKQFSEKPMLLCPMIDARKMEVFLKLEDSACSEVWSPQSLTLQSNIFNPFEDSVAVFGSGMPKFRDINQRKKNIFFDGIDPNAKHMGNSAKEKYAEKRFENIFHFDPSYLKNWQPTVPKKKNF